MPAYGSSPGSPYGGGEAAGSADYFSDSPGGGEKAVPPKEKEGEGGDTAILPKSILAGKDFKPGEEVVLKIVRIHDDSVEVSYAPEKGGGEAPPEAAGAAGMPEMAGGGGGGGSMAGLMG